MEFRSRRLMRETSPDRAKVCLKPRVKPIKKVQVVYYLSRNGHLEHPHYMEVTHLADQPLRLKDVMERLSILRGKGMPSLYSWSCKRSYKNGYVWNDLAENDSVYTAEGAEYVLKGSELVEGCSARLQQIQISNTNKQADMNFQARETKPKYEECRDRDHSDEEEEFDYELLDEEKTTTSSHTSSTTPRSRCSRGVSTDELDDTTHQNDASVVVSGAGSGRSSVLLQLIACGSSAVAKAKPNSVTSRSTNVTKSLHRGVLCKSAAAKSSDEEMIKFMSENPRFGNVQAEEKEYFSGSIVESMADGRDVAVPPVLKKSNSYNEDRSTKAGLEETVDEVKREKAKTTGKCIPRKRSCASTKHESKKCAT